MNFNKLFILCIGCVALMSGITSCSVQAKIKKADQKYQIGEYYDAANIYRQCYSKLSSKSDRTLKAQVAFRQGECYRILNNSKAITAYKNAAKLSYPDSSVYLRLAQCQQYQGKYQDAANSYTKYLQLNPASSVAQAGLIACEEVNQWKQLPTQYKLAVATELNRKNSSTFSPAFIGDDADAIFFTSNRTVSKKKTTKRPSPVTGKRTFNLYTARKDANGKWVDISMPEGLYDSPEQNEAQDNQQANDSTTNSQQTGTAELGACSLTADGKSLFFTFVLPINGQDLGTKIFRSDRAGGEWGEPQEIKLFADSTISVGHPAINATGDTLYFVSDAPNGYGGKDIYRAVGEGLTWGEITNLGPKINTPDDELFPTIRKNGMLYFSSKGHPGYGGLDIFRVSLYEDTTVVNMGLPFNSNKDDFGITFENDKENGFFSSNRDQKSGNDIIYRFYMPEIILLLEGKMLDHNGETIGDGIIRLVGTDGTNQKVPIRRDGTYRLRLQPDTKYVMLATSRGFLNQKQDLQTPKITDSRTYTQDFKLSPVSRPVTMNNVFYEFGKWELTEQSSQELMQLVKLLQDNPNITIELSAHTDMVGDSVSNLTLSHKRAQSCVDYLINKGIEKERLTPVGYGKNMPVTASPTLHQQHPFIPEGQVLNEVFIKSLTDEQQQICNQINRRTEFKVLKTTYKLY